MVRDLSLQFVVRKAAIDIAKEAICVYVESLNQDSAPFSV
jgi:hypothetical protein